MHHAKAFIALLIASLALAACAVAPPSGPSGMILPAEGKSFEQFQADDATCQQYASDRIDNGTPQHAANESGAASAAVGTTVGAAAGALIGVAVGDPAIGAAIGGGSGLLLSSMIGMSNAYASGVALQQRYDMAYTQCMVAKGESAPLAQNDSAFYHPGYYYYPYPYAYPY